MFDLRAIFGWIDPRLRLRWAVLVPVVCAAAVLEALGAIAVFGLLRLVVEPHRVRSTPVVSRLWLAWPSDDPAQIIAALTAVVALFYIARAVLLSWSEWLKESTVGRSAAQAGERLFSHYLHADYAFHLRRRSASMIQEVARSTDVAFQLMAASAVNIIAEVAIIVALIAVLIVTAPPQTLLVVVGVLALVALPIFSTRRMWVRSGEWQKTLEEQHLHVLQQSLGAVKEVKVAGRESFFEQRFRGVRRTLSQVRQHRAWLSTTLRLGVETALIICMLAVVLVVTMRGTSGAETVSLLALFAYTGFRVVPSANRIMLNAGYLREGHAFTRDARDDFAMLRTAATPRGHGPEPVVDFSHALVCEDVSFSYGDGPPAISNIYLRLKPGESLGIVGATGAGKSTLVDVLLGLLQPTSGQLLLDGEELRGKERAWQRLIGYVPQNPYVLDDTVRRNIAFGVPDTLIDEQRLSRAVALAQLDEVIQQLPEGLDTPLGEHGTRLSGGQKQRVAIARALYSDPAVLVFDEATAALDNQTEREVTRAIAALHGTRTLIVIAHRLSTVEACDRLIFLQAGRIAATGTYNELLSHAAFKSMALL
ncbi:MAG TPA: ABC transporter ATP-binding protein [Vicinamibacterales bacterium]|nr:ABC transporter ATP-binding protein [Vicinamibacterales bacterium]